MIYLDNSATTPLSRASIDAITKTLEIFGNPSSVHSAGLDAAALVNKAREEMYDGFGLTRSLRIDGRLPIGAGGRDAYRFFFTSGGSESDNTAVFGLLRAKKIREIPRIITTDSEHPAILEPIAAAASMGLCEYRLIPTHGGKLDMNALSEALSPNTLLVSIMQVNNETGAIYDLRTAFSEVHKRVPTALCHTDAVQGFLKTNSPLIGTGADMVSISGHKFGAPKGIGGLLIKNSLLTSKKIVPLIYGGGQEGGMRSGTENLLSIVAMGASCHDEYKHLADHCDVVRKNRELFIDTIMSSQLSAKVNVPENYLPHIISLTVYGVRSETLVRALSGRGICISNGSACSSHGGHRTIAGVSVLEAFGLSRSDADSTVRISISHQNTADELIMAANAIADIASGLVHK